MNFLRTHDGGVLVRAAGWFTEVDEVIAGQENETSPKYSFRN